MTFSKATSSQVLVTLGVLFTIGGAARFLPNALATAETATETMQTTTQTSGGDPNVALANIISPNETLTLHPTETGQVCFTGEAAERATKSLDEIEARTNALDQRAISLSTQDAEIQQRLNELEAIESRLNKRWQDMTAEAEMDITHLAQMYGAMKPDQAAQIFDKMDPSFAAGFLRELKSEQAGLILARMDANKAYAVSIKIAARNDDIRTGQ
jgi:flagellar motility protein MotE (MotC chaperone)